MNHTKIKKLDEQDRIEGDRIVIFDKLDPDQKILKTVEIITPGGRRKRYEIRRTRKGGYLFNK